MLAVDQCRVAEVGCDTESAEAPGSRGATTAAYPCGTQGRSNEASRDASALECYRISGSGPWWCTATSPRAARRRWTRSPGAVLALSAARAAAQDPGPAGALEKLRPPPPSCACAPEVEAILRARSSLDVGSGARANGMGGASSPAPTTRPPRPGTPPPSAI